MELPYRDGSDNYGQALEQFLAECTKLATERHMEWRKNNAVVNGASWGFDGKTGLLSFTFGGIGVSYAAQVVGTWSEKTQSFLWSWANSSMPAELTQAAAKAKAVGEERGCPLLTERKLDCDENLAMSLASAVSVMTDLPICYRAPAGPGLYIYFIFKDKSASPQEETESAAADSGGEIAHGTFGDFEYGVYEDGAVIVQYTGEDEEVTVPAEIDGVKVVELIKNSFLGAGSLKRVTVPENVLCIGANAFAQCSALERVDLPESLTTVGYMAFSGCPELASIKIPNGVTSLGEGAFEECEKLGSAVLSDKIAVIPSGAFGYCKSLTSVELPKGLTEIGEGAFNFCKSLTAVNLPKDVNKVGVGAFAGCSALSKITVDGENKSFTSLDGALFSKDRKTLIACPGGVSGEYAVPEGTEVIGPRAFCGCKGITSVTFPESVRRIEKSAFFMCSSLESTVLPSRLEFLGGGAFERCESLKELVVPSGVAKLNDYTFSGCASLKTVTVPEETAEFGQDVFKNVKKVTICSNDGSPAQRYAKKEKLSFTALDKKPSFLSKVFSKKKGE
ncbi:MAG: leucine-rich repeat domain-containing protein [Thermoguttaceae bacterium]|nr:leucine-rich repeat domain-containing protein [Thermoguttaceae bacterium]